MSETEIQFLESFGDNFNCDLVTGSDYVPAELHAGTHHVKDIMDDVISVTHTPV